MSKSCLLIRTAMLAVSIFAGFAGSAHAALIQWSYEATIVDVFGSPFGLNGETIGMSVTLDATDVWQGAPQWGPCCLLFPSIASSAFITGPHTVALNTPLPPAWTDNTRGIGGFQESLSNTVSGFDFIIDAIQTFTLLSGPRALAPSLGDNLLPEHLPSTLGNGFLIDFWDFLLVDPVVTVSIVSDIPEPATLVLLGSGLVGLFGCARRKNE